MNDIYCDQIINKKLKIDILIETENVLAFNHTSPYWETHIVVIPKKHIESITKISLEESFILQELISVATQVCKDVEVKYGGCSLVTNVGDYQTSKHLHFYIHSGKRLKP